MTVFKIALLVLSLLLSLLVASVFGGLLDYGILETYEIAVTSFDANDWFSYIFVLVLFLPLILILAFVGLGAFAQVVRSR